MPTDKPRIIKDLSKLTAADLCGEWVAHDARIEELRHEAMPEVSESPARRQALYRARERHEEYRRALVGELEARGDEGTAALRSLFDAGTIMQKLLLGHVVARLFPAFAYQRAKAYLATQAPDAKGRGALELWMTTIPRAKRGEPGAC